MNGVDELDEVVRHLELEGVDAHVEGELLGGVRSGTGVGEDEVLAGGHGVGIGQAHPDEQREAADQDERQGRQSGHQADHDRGGGHDL